jgi:hypothetical protein
MSASTRPSILDDARLLDGANNVSEFARASDLVKRLLGSQPSTAEVLQELRRRFPNAPLSTRIAALAALRSG